MNNREFSTLITWDLDTYKEFSKGALFTMKYRMILEVIAIWYLIAYIFAIGFTKNDFGFLSVATILLIIWAVVKLVTCKGGIQYKRMLSNNNDQPPRNRLMISEEGVQAESLDNGNTTALAFHRIRSIAETNNLLILMMEYRQGFIIDKRTLTGGTYDELVEFLLSVCTNLKKRKIYYGRGTRIRKGIILFLILACFIFALIQEIRNDKEIPSGMNHEEMYGLSSGKLNDLSYKEIAEELQNLGFEPISEELLVQLQNDWEQISKEEQQYMDKTDGLLPLLMSMLSIWNS